MHFSGRSFGGRLLPLPTGTSRTSRCSTLCMPCCVAASAAVDYTLHYRAGISPHTTPLHWRFCVAQRAAGGCCHAYSLPCHHGAFLFPPGCSPVCCLRYFTLRRTPFRARGIWRDCGAHTRTAAGHRRVVGHAGHFLVGKRGVAFSPRYAGNSPGTH